MTFDATKPLHPVGRVQCKGSGGRWTTGKACSGCGKGPMMLAVPDPARNPLGGYCGHVPTHWVAWSEDGSDLLSALQRSIEAARAARGKTRD